MVIEKGGVHRGVHGIGDACGSGGGEARQEHTISGTTRKCEVKAAVIRRMKNSLLGI